jgi:enterochelin esterase-like enzyme
LPGSLTVFLSVGIRIGMSANSNLAEVLEAQGYPVEFHSVREGQTWSHWRGASDEMLVYFFGAD